VDIYRSQTPALRTVIAPDFLDLSIQQVGRDVFGDAQYVGALQTFVVAKALPAGADTADDDG